MNAGLFRQQIAGLTALYKQGKLQESLLQAEALAKQFPNEPVTANLLGAVYVGLDWEDQCLEFHNTRRAIQTASVMQVRQKMYRGSSDAWRKYEKHLGTMVESLGGF